MTGLTEKLDGKIEFWGGSEGDDERGGDERTSF
jgi:hypothetical protein